MATVKKYAFEPDYIVPPGVTLKEILDSQGMSQSDLAARAGMAEKTVSQIINGIAPLSVDTADKLELVLAVPAGFWNRRELAYREALARGEEAERFADDIEWLKEIPVKELISRNFIEPTRNKPLLVRQALQFFGVSSVDAWRSLIDSRSIQFLGGAAHNRKPGHVAAWRRLGVLQSQQIETGPFNAQEFRNALRSIRSLAIKPAKEWRTELPILCASAGVAFVFTREIPGAAVSGLARWITRDKGLIQLSLKYKTDDHIWFTFFHEAGHLLLHSKKQVFTDCGYNDATEEEREANDFARDILIPPELSSRLPHLRKRSQIKKFAEEAGITAGIVVGRLQNERLVRPDAFNDLKKKIAWNNDD